MKTAIKFIAPFFIAFFSILFCFSQGSNTKVPAPVVKSVLSKDLLWMIAAIVVLLALILWMPKKTKRTTVYVKDKNGNIKAVTQTMIRGKKVQTE